MTPPPLLVPSEQVTVSGSDPPAEALAQRSPDHEWKRIYCQHCGHSHDIPVYCGNRFCPVCGRHRLFRTRDRLRWIIRQVNPKRPRSIKFLTLTIPSMPDPGKMVKVLIKSFRKLRNSAEWKKKVSGGAFVLEVKHGKIGWHVHLHAIVECEYFKQQHLLALWRKFSPGRGVWITEIPIGKAVGYITKYLAKPSVEVDLLEDANKILKGTRLFSPFGSWYGLNITYPKHTFVCPVCGTSSWMWEGHWEKLIESYGTPI